MNQLRKCLLLLHFNLTVNYPQQSGLGHLDTPHGVGLGCPVSTKTGLWGKKLSPKEMASLSTTGAPAHAVLADQSDAVTGYVMKINKLLPQRMCVGGSMVITEIRGLGGVGVGKNTRESFS